MFHTQMKNGVTFLTAGALASDGIRHGFSTRLGGVSPAPWDSLNLDDRRGDDIANVQENFRRLCAALDMDVRRAVLSRQIHRDDVRLVTAADCGKGLWVPQDYDSADALITDVPGIPLVVFSADCNVILLHDPVCRAVGAAHAGWAGHRRRHRWQDRPRHAGCLRLRSRPYPRRHWPRHRAVLL